MSNPPVHAGWRRHRTLLRRAGVALLVLYLAYLAAANVFLNTRIGEQVINRKPDRYHARWDWALSAYPGHIHARGVVMGGHARQNRWFVASPRADGRIKLLPLLWKEVAFGTIRGHDVSVHVQRVAEDKPTNKRPGKAPWTLRFDAITTPSLLRMDFYGARVSGHGDARFVFEKVLQGGPMEVGRSTLRMPDATLAVEGVELLREGHLEFDIAIPAHIRERAQGEEKVALLDASMRIDGPAPGIDLVARNGEALPIGTSGSSGHLRADLRLTRGVLMPGSRLDWSAPVFSRDADGRPLRHPLGVALRTDEAAIHVAARVRPAAGEPTPRLHADLRVDDRRLGPDDWLRPLRALGGTVDARWAAVPLRWVDLLLDDIDWLAVDGRADLAAALRLADGRLQPGSTVDLERVQLGARILDNLFSGRAQARMRVHEDAEAGQRTTIGILMERFTLAPQATPGRVDLRGRDLRLDLASTGPLAGFHEHLDAYLKFDDAEVPDLRSYNRYLPGDSARLVGGSGRASGDIRLDNAGEMVSGRMRVRGQDVRVALGPSQLSGNVDMDSRLSRARKQGRRYAIDALTVQLDGVRLVDEDTADDAPWWARLALEDGVLDWQEPFGLSGRGRVEMRDVSVLLGLFAERKVFPRWIGNLIDSGEARASGDLRISGQQVVFDRVEASNDRIGLQARLRIDNGRPDGDLYARWGVFGLGVELQDGERKLHLAGARDWYEGRPALLPE